MAEIPDFPYRPSLCRNCNHLMENHNGAACTATIGEMATNRGLLEFLCDCEGFALPFTKSDVRKQIRFWVEHKKPLAELAELLDTPLEDLLEEAERIADEDQHSH